MSLTFEQHINGIEDAALACLQAKMTNVQNFRIYAGELEGDSFGNSEKMEKLSQLKEDFPLVLCGYADGADAEDAAVGRAAVSPGNFRPQYFRHDCSFVFFCLASNPRGAEARKRGGGGGTGVIEMISEVRENLSGVQFLVTVDGEQIPLNAPLKPKGNEYIARIPGITAYAVVFDTYFRYSTRPENVTEIDVTQLITKVDVINPRALPQTQLPGVRLGK